MTYEKPDVRDLGDIAEHTYFHGDDGDFCGSSAQIGDDVDS